MPKRRRGARRANNRRVISDIVHMVRTGARWRDCPTQYGPYTTIYNRFNRLSKQGVWEDVFQALIGSSGVIASAVMDSSYVEVHRSAVGAKGGLQPCDRAPRGGRTTKVHAMTDPLGCPVAIAHTPGRYSRSGWRRRPVAALPAAAPADRRPRLRRAKIPRLAPGARLRSRHPAQSDPQAPAPTRCPGLQAARLDRAHVLPP